MLYAKQRLSYFAHAQNQYRRLRAIRKQQKRRSAIDIFFPPRLRNGASSACYATFLMERRAFAGYRVYTACVLWTLRKVSIPKKILRSEFSQRLAPAVARPRSVLRGVLHCEEDSSRSSKNTQSLNSPPPSRPLYLVFFCNTLSAPSPPFFFWFDVTPNSGGREGGGGRRPIRSFVLIG